MKRLFIIDAMAMAYRNFFAFSRTRLTNIDGVPTGALYGCAQFLHKLITEEKPDYLFMALDVSGKVFRHDLYADYKANREEMPVDLRSQLILLEDLYRSMNIPVLQHTGYEADDVIGSIAHQYASPDLRVVIVSGDKDFYQLINDNVLLYTPKKDQPAEIVDIEGVREKFSCEPHQVVECLALIGDKADNVPGVKGIGEKGAATLIAKYGSLEKIYEHIEDIKGKKQKASLIDFRSDAFLSRELVIIEKNLKFSKEKIFKIFDWSSSVDNSELADFYERMDFRQLLKKQSFHSKVVVKDHEIKSVDIETFYGLVKKDGLMYFAIVTKNDHPIDNKVLCIVLRTSNDHVCSVDYSNQDQADALSLLLKDQNVSKICHGLKRSIHGLNSIGLKIQGKCIDTMIADYLLDPNSNQHSLEHCLYRVFGEEWDESCVDDLATYQSWVVKRLWQVYESKIEKTGQKELFYGIEIPLVFNIAQVEANGIYIDIEFLKRYSQKLATSEKKIQSKIFDIAGEDFNIASPKELQRIIFEKLKIHEKLNIKKIKKTKTGYSTDESVLRSMGEHPLSGLILEYRSVVKLRGTYLDPLPEHVCKETGRLHTHFRQVMAATGRLSSDHPNLQNIPFRSAMGREIRKAFKSEDEGFVFLSADYSQVEIRLLAHFANEEYLISAFKNGEDIHQATAAKIFSVPLDEVSPDLRSRAKAVNFGIIYGMGPQRLAQETGVSLPEAKQFMNKYFEAYPGIKKYTDELFRLASEKGYSETIRGRRRPIPGLNDPNSAVQSRARNMAINSPIQGSAADLIKVAMNRVSERIKVESLPVRLLLQIHDELVFEVKEDAIESVSKIIRESMENVFDLRVPMKVDIGCGENWLEAH